ncbi:MAG: hypothetical protein ABSB95_04520 [Dissulfurispiraceae bacterium]
MMSNKQHHSAKAELNRQNKIAAGLVSERFPKVKSIVVNMTYYQKGVNPVLMVRMVNILPTTYAYFNMECMIRDCVNGGFELTPIITRMVKGMKKTLKGKLTCKGKNDGLEPDHASIEYEIAIKYNNKKTGDR